MSAVRETPQAPAVLPSDVASASGAGRGRRRLPTNRCFGDPTSPWRFYVRGPEAGHAYGLALGDRKARKLENPVAVVGQENPEIREEDYAAAMMGIENLALAAVELVLGTHIKTGGVMADPAARAARSSGGRSA